LLHESAFARTEPSAGCIGGQGALEQRGRRSCVTARFEQRGEVQEAAEVLVVADERLQVGLMRRRDVSSRLGKDA